MDAVKFTLTCLSQVLKSNSSSALRFSVDFYVLSLIFINVVKKIKEKQILL